MKVLVVDDSRNDRKIIRYNFEWHGWLVSEASNGREGLEAARREIPDLILSDCLMPIMDGFHFLHEIKKIDQLKDIPFVFYSAVYTGNREAELSLSLGALAFIEKPKDPEQLWEEVGRIMAAQSAGEAKGRLTVLREEEFLRNYGEVVAGKLEEKVRELSEMNESLVRLNSELERRVIDRTSQLEAANDELEMITYAISHDLRAPLRHLDGFGQALMEECAGKINSSGKNYLERIRNASQRMLTMIDAVMDFSRFARGNLHREMVDLTALVWEIADQLMGSARDRKVTFRIAEGMRVRADAQLIRVVLENLLGNAWKFTAGKEDAVIEVYTTEWDGRLAFAVRDNGLGFDMGHAGRLFAPFQKMHSQEEYPGRGVGLAIARRIVHRHGGRIKAEAEPGAGAIFTFTV